MEGRGEETREGCVATNPDSLASIAAASARGGWKSGGGAAGETEGGERGERARERERKGFFEREKERERERPMGPKLGRQIVRGARE
ncbi:unnamed protein product [Bursaphelenchus xylophilus]|uniref:(pine wood nematode) hypothetical protein n=1 Tax=Bursaphelenchus xylophilus TaxID=6326 RepID=A0A1I7S9R4_BURXY|nr:unnamed protein product [Bursaphelenchus xylophilus]CAG9129188.1 unnamed protein product [Bursaphelenchus xylophilus]